MDIKVVKLHEDSKLPVYANKGDACADIYYYGPDYILRPGDINVFGIGLSMEIPEGYELQIRPRSGLAAKYGITVLNTPGTIDSGYRDEVGVILINHGIKPYSFEKHDRIAQIALKEIIDMGFDVVKELSDSERGKRGFGSSGKR